MVDFKNVALNPFENEVYLIVFLYLASVLIWGSTWLVITFQLGTVPLFYAIGYRFILASFCLFCIILLKNRAWPKFSLQEHMFLFLQGIFMFCLNYVGFYFATQYMVSGLVAVIFSSIIFFNITMAAFFFDIKIRLPMVIGASMGVCGIGMIFLNDIQSLSLGSEMVQGGIYALLATLSASCGNMVSTHLQKKGCGVLDISAVAMGYGAGITMVVGLASGAPLVFDFSTTYILSLLYLSIIGSSLAFWCYLTLLGKIGPDKSAYALVGTPVVALILSAFFEGFQWTPQAILGICLVLFGNIIVLWRKR